MDPIRSLVGVLLVVTLVLLTVTGVTAAEEPNATVTETPRSADAQAEETTVASDDPFSGFTLGAAIAAVLLVGVYRYFSE